jgi:hypothetical protein
MPNRRLFAQEETNGMARQTHQNKSRLIEVIVATEPSLISILIATQATTWKPRIADWALANLYDVHVQPMESVCNILVLEAIN